jgi:hypothetical protein
MIAEKFEIHWSQMGKSAPKLSTLDGKNFEFARLKWLKMH